MSMHAPINIDQDEYELYLTNEEVENQLGDFDRLSSASNWTVNLDENIDFSNFTFMKGNSCDLGVSKSWIDAFPLTYSNDESVEVHIKISEQLGQINQLYSSGIIKRRFNNQSYIIPLPSHSATDSDFAVDLLTQSITSPITHFLLRASLKIVFDTDVFSENHLKAMTLEDIKLLNRYLDIAIYSRGEIHKHLQSKLPETDNIDNLITFQSTDRYTQAKEAKTIASSHTLRPVTDRPRSRDSNAMNLSIFYGVDLSKADALGENGPKQAIVHETEQFIAELGIEDMINTGTQEDPVYTLTENSKSSFRKLVTANLALIHQAIKARKMLAILHNKADKRTSTSRTKEKDQDLFQLVIDSHSGKVHCVTKTDNFLCDDGTQVTVNLPPKCSYRLGAKPGNLLILGPASTTPLRIDGDISRTSHTLTYEHQSPPCCARPYPRLLHVITDLAGPLKKDLWLRGTRFADYNIVYTLIIDDVAISNKFLTKQTDDVLYYRMNSLKTSLNSIDVYITDENFQLVDFMPLCYCRLAIKIKVSTPP